MMPNIPVVSARAVFLLVIAFVLPALCPDGVRAQHAAEETRHFLFSYFTGNGEDGLRLAYSQDGLHWQAVNGGEPLLAPRVGNDRLMRDPSIVRGPDGTYHMVWTVSWNERGIGYAHSDDLIHWSEQQYLPVMEHESDARNCWAPELYYNEARNRYLILWASTVPGRFPATDRQDVAHGGAQGWNHRIYAVTTADFDTFSETTLFYEPGFNVIDAAIVSTDSQHVMLLKDETGEPFDPEKNIRLAFADDAMGPYSAPTDPITGDYWAEGPSGIQIGGRWYVYFDKYIEGHYGVVVSDDLTTWTDRSDELDVPDGMNHGTVFEVPKETADALLKLNR